MKKLPVVKSDMWLNSRSLDYSDFQNRIILVDFWNYTCMRCRRSLTYLKDWWQKYQDEGFLIIGVHSPKFEFEKNHNHVAKTLEQLGVTWPVAMDNDYFNWHNFNNEQRPERYIGDLMGNVIYQQRGEGNYEEMEQVIAGLLCAKNPGLSFPVIQKGKSENGFCHTHTPNLYCGYSHGAIINKEGYRLGRIMNYSRPKLLPEDSLGLSGEWLVGDEYIESISPDATLYLNFQAKEVYVVAETARDEAVIKIDINGRTPISGNLGEHLNLAGEARIKWPTVYHLTSKGREQRRLLKLSIISGKVRLYAFSFYGC